MTKIVSRRKFGFKLRPLNVKKEPHPVFYVSQRSSFWIATLSLLAFMIGNMVGQHGWYLFWASVLGKEEIVYTGTVSPIEKVPNYQLWYSYGGDPASHTFRQVPSDFLITLPKYTKSNSSNIFYSVSFMGNYDGDSEGSGSHPGVDIRVPIGTPVRSIANGIVYDVKTGGGFGNVIVVRHPNVPDPGNPKKTTTLYSSYAHLNSVGVVKGSIVSKGEEIGTSGMSGFASGPHLHFQIDREDAPWFPYWPFTTDEQHAAGIATTAQAVNAGLNSTNGYKYSVSPMLYVQANYTAVLEDAVPAEKYTSKSLLSAVEQRRLDRINSISTKTTLLALHTPDVSSVITNSQENSSSAFSSAPGTTVTPRLSPALRALEARKQRIADRLLNSSIDVDLNSLFSYLQPKNTVTKQRTVSAKTNGTTAVSGIAFRHDGSFSGREWEKVTITLLDANGNTAVSPILPSTLYLRTAYGEAEFKPSELNELDFVNGEISIYVLPRGRRTVVIQVKPFEDQSKPMIFEELVASY